MQIVASNQEKCVGCNRCVRECPIETTNITYQDGDGNIKVRIDESKCITCGACISVCKHDARYYIDDTAQFFEDLAQGIPISLIAAPSIRTNIPDHKRLFTWLKSLGVHAIYDVSLGADICTWAHIRYIQQFSPPPLITQPCAAIVSYCEIHRPSLVKYLSPVQSPMACMAVYMRLHEGIKTRIASISPCIAKKNEFTATGLIDYNITYAKLQEYLQAHPITLPQQETAFDNPDAALGALYPLPGGLKENIEFLLGKSLRIDQSEGRHAYRNMNDFLKTDATKLPKIFDVLNCADGCNGGSGRSHTQNVFEVHYDMDAVRNTLSRQHLVSLYEEMHRKFDATLKLADYLRVYAPTAPEPPEVSEDKIQEAFRLLDKDTYAKQNFNCGACGSNTCRDMAKKIAMKVNIPSNCIVRTRDLLEAEHNKNIELYDRNISFIQMVQHMGNYLLSAGEDTYQDVLRKALNDLCSVLHAHSAHVCKRVCAADGSYRFVPTMHWPDIAAAPQGEGADAKLQHWAELTVSDKPLNKLKADFTPAELALFPKAEVYSLAMVPVMVRGIFWGIVVIAGGRNRLFDDEEMAVTLASGSVIISSIVERETASSMREADAHIQKLEEVSYIDSLTGIYNRRFLNLRIDAEMRKSFDNGSPLTLCMMDIDYFKKINDTYGHLYGDEVLVRLAAIIDETLDEGSIWGRYGGEEFMILFTSCDLEKAAAKVNAVMERICSEQWTHGDKITVSCGLSTYTHGVFFSDFIKSADKNLYKAKECGRNRLVYK